MKLPSIPYLVNSFLSVARRFPFVMAAAIFGVIVSMIIIEVPYDLEYIYVEMLMAALFALPLLLSSAIAAEKWNLSGVKKWLPSILTILVAVGYYFTLDISNDNINEKTAIQFVGLILVGHLLVSYLPYIDKAPLEDFWEYNRQLFSNFMTGVFYCIIIFAGLSIAILAIDNLFDLDVDEDIYGHLFVMIAGIINTTYFLFNFPKKYIGLSDSSGGYNKMFINFSKFILIPIVGIYFLILYAYTFKILGTWELPKGWVSSLVLGFSVAGIFTYLLNYLLVNYDDSKLVRKYRKWFFFVLAPMVVLLFVAIGRRLGDYGVTEPRYIVATLGVWLLIVAIYFIISKKDNIKFIPISLSIFALISILGPLSMFNISEKNQIGRLEELLLKNNMLEGGLVVPSDGEISSEDADNIYSILYYLKNNGHFAPVAPWFELEAAPDYSDLDTALDDLGLLGARNSTMNTYCNVYFDRTRTVAINNYEELIFPEINVKRNVDAKGWEVVKISDSNSWELNKDGVAVDTIDISGYLNSLNEKYNCDTGEFESEDAEYAVSGSQYDVVLVTEWLEYNIEEGLSFGSWRGSMLLRKKQ